MEEKILYVSDLDGTLLNNEVKLSDFTIKAINALMDKGMIFSFATARSQYTGTKVSRGIVPKVPIIIYNGTFIYDVASKKRVVSNSYTKAEANEILNALLENSVYPMVHAFLGEQEKYLFDERNMSRGMADFQSKRELDERRTPVDVYDLEEYEVFYFTCIDEEEKLLPLYEKFKRSYQCLYTKDIYSGDYWLEILPNNATKAKAIAELKRLLDCTKVICFGDGTNDIEMFKYADEAYAVSNAHPELKKYATAIIESNENDGVARWLIANYK